MKYFDIKVIPKRRRIEVKDIWSTYYPMHKRVNFVTKKISIGWWLEF